MAEPPTPDRCIADPFLEQLVHRLYAATCPFSPAANFASTTALCFASLRVAKTRWTNGMSSSAEPVHRIFHSSTVSMICAAGSWLLCRSFGMGWKGDDTHFAQGIW